MTKESNVCTEKKEVDIQKVLEKEIDLIQNCINRMSQHSFYLKGWLVTLIGILFALKPANLILVNICLIFISILFWYLNATYLRYEKQYRELYDWVIKARLNNNTDFLYNLRLDINERFISSVDSRFKIMFQNTLLTFYGSLTLLLIFVLIFLVYKDDIHNVLDLLIIILNNINILLNNLNKIIKIL